MGSHTPSNLSHSVSMYQRCSCCSESEGYMSCCYGPDHFTHATSPHPRHPRVIQTMPHCPHIPQYLRAPLLLAPPPLKLLAAEALPSSRQINNIQMPRQSLVFSIADFDLAYPETLDVAQHVHEGQLPVF